MSETTVLPAEATAAAREGASRASDEELIQELGRARTRIRGEIAKRIVGQDAVIDQLLVALFSRGHCLFVGVPGLAKTLLISTLAEALSLTFNRIQFTPDLMPSDITGTDVLEEDHTTGRRVFRFVPGPVFANVLLADEINRTPPKTQAALLQAMQEHRVTAGGRTYPLPEAQLDRFMFMVDVGYPSAEEEVQIVRATTSGAFPQLVKILAPEQIRALQELVLRVPAAEHVIRYAVEMVRSTRPGETADKQVKDHVSWGAGPRASQALILGAKARSALDGRPAATVEDVRALAEPVLRHRVLTNFHAEAEGIDSRAVIAQLLRVQRA